MLVPSSRLGSSRSSQQDPTTFMLNCSCATRWVADTFSAPFVSLLEARWLWLTNASVFTPTANELIIRVFQYCFDTVHALAVIVRTFISIYLSAPQITSYEVPSYSSQESTVALFQPNCHTAYCTWHQTSPSSCLFAVYEPQWVHLFSSNTPPKADLLPSLNYSFIPSCSLLISL